jgi:hypothetical protein
MIIRFILLLKKRRSDDNKGINPLSKKRGFCFYIQSKRFECPINWFGSMRKTSERLIIFSLN